MKQLVIVAAMLAALFGMHVGAEKVQRFSIVSGYLTSTDSEVDEGYFAIGSKTMLKVEPGTPGWHRIQEFRGKVITLVVEVDGTP